MQCKELVRGLETTWPRSFAENWDNVGLLAGRADKEIRNVLLALDATDSVVEEAVRRGADLLLTHHPLIFSARKQINDGDFIGRRLIKLLGADICCYAMHTNFDVLSMADAAADRIGLKERRVLDVTFEDGERQEGIGRLGRLPETVSLKVLGEQIKKAFHLESVKIFGEGEQRVSLTAICPGSGKSVIGKSVELGADVLITGDIDHHDGIDGMAMGLCVVDAGHYGLEQIFLPYMEAYLKQEWKELNVWRAGEKNPFWIL